MTENSMCFLYMPGSRTGSRLVMSESAGNVKSLVFAVVEKAKKIGRAPWCVRKALQAAYSSKSVSNYILLGDKK